MSVVGPQHIGCFNALGVWTLYRREMVRSFKIWVITIAAPALQALMMAAVFALVIASATSGFLSRDFLAFLLPGLVAAGVLERAFAATAFSIIYDKLEGSIGDLLIAPMTPAELLLSYALSAVSGGLLAGIAVWLILVPFGLGAPVAPVAVLFFSAAGAVMIGLFAQIAALWARKWDHISAVQTFVVVPFVFLSGVFFPLERLSSLGQSLIHLNPLFYVVSGVRFGMTGVTEANPWMGAAVVLTVAAALGLISHVLLARGYNLKS
ncbi:MAG: ABC transporter permease [Alphaproteobacteria bacterium]